jgi:urease beta subunit
MTDPMVPGEVIGPDDPIEINQDRPIVVVSVVNRGDRPIQVGSHFHFSEANGALEFDRTLAFGCRLDVPAGTSVRFEPGIDREVGLVPLRGRRRVLGLRGQVRGDLDKAP